MRQLPYCSCGSNFCACECPVAGTLALVSYSLCGHLPVRKICRSRSRLEFGVNRSDICDWWRRADSTIGLLPTVRPLQDVLKTFNRHASRILGKSKYSAISSSNGVLHDTSIIQHTPCKHGTKHQDTRICVRSSKGTLWDVHVKNLVDQPTKHTILALNSAQGTKAITTITQWKSKKSKVMIRISMHKWSLAQ